MAKSTQESSASPRKPKVAAKSSVKKDSNEKPAGGDLRAMFKNAPKPKVISLDDSDEEDVKPKASASTSKAKKTIDLESSDEDIKPSTSAKPSSSKHFPTKNAAASSSTSATTGQKRKIAKTESGSDEESNAPPQKRQSLGGGKKGVVASESTSKKKAVKKEESEDEDEDYKMDLDTPPPPADKKKPPPKKAIKAEVASVSSGSSSSEEEEEEEEEKKPKKKAVAKPKVAAKPKPKPKPAAKTKGTPDKKGKKELKAVDVPPFDFEFAAKRREDAGIEIGDIPESPAPNCLGGLTFVFTGELDKLGREEAQELVKKHGGRVTGSPSTKTSYVVVGRDAGQKKLEVIANYGLHVLTEQNLLDLIRYSGGAQYDDKQLEARAKQEKAIVKAAKELAEQEKEEEETRRRKAKVLERNGAPAKVAPAPSNMLWTTKYAPTKLAEICGNKGLVTKMGAWLENWPAAYSSNFKKPGKEGFGTFKAILLSGPPGIGKTTSAHLIAKMHGYSPIELNASDARSKKLLENAINIDNASLDSWFSGGSVMDTAAAGVRINKRTCLILDEVDGMSGGDRGGVGAMNVLIKKTRIPLILICNDATLQKMKPLQATTYPMKFKRPTAAEIRSRIMSILYKEKMKLDGNVVDQLVETSQSDIRQILNMLSTWKLSNTTMSFDEGRALGQSNAKYTIQTPFTIIPQLLGPYAFSSTNKMTLGDRMELYFQDFSFVPLFMQENYIRNDLPAKCSSGNDPESVLQRLSLFSKAADSISDGDLIDRLIHGQEQHWSLLPVHAVASTVRPASYVYGKSAPKAGGGWSSYGCSFPQFLGQNSKRTKLARMLGDIQVKMRLKVTGSREEVRQDYMPLLSVKTLLPFTEKGHDAGAVVDDIIPYLDEYYLNKEDWDTLLELGVGEMHQDLINKKIPSASKSTFTRVYNKMDHPVAFHKADMFAAKKVVADKGPAPDLDDVFDDDDDIPADDDSQDGSAEGKNEDEDDLNDIKKDKLIKAVTGKGKSKASAAAAKKRRSTSPVKKEKMG